ncbi:MAG: PAS domain S-box protein [Deltaproteobacteria bacterium]|nr:PAS domain S-box protein [Deltaproteobacteria bacterium]
MFQTHFHEVLRAKLLSMMVFRVALVFAFLAITLWSQLRSAPQSEADYNPLYVIAAVIGLLTILYAATLKRVKNVRGLAYLQTIIDIVIISVIVFVTGSIASYLSILYFFSIIGSSIFLNRTGGLFAASLSSLLYVFVLEMDFYNLLPQGYKVLWPVAEPLWQDLSTTLSTNILAFFTVAYLTGYLAERGAVAEKELKEKEMDLAKLEDLNRQIIENIPCGIMTLDIEGRITSFNPVAEEITGLKLKDVYGRDAMELIDAIFEENLEVAAGVRVEKMYKAKDSARYVGFTMAPGKGDDAAKIVILQDITRIKTLEDELRRDEKLKALGELSVGIAHEIRNPLASISGSIEVLGAAANPGSERGRLMEIVLKETGRLNALITDFLLFARPVQGEKERADISRIIRDTAEVFKNSPEATGIVISMDVGTDTFIECNTRQMGQVFWNLFINAGHAMAGKGRLDVRLDAASSRHHARGFFEITVSDTGAGIADNDLFRIFDPFYSTKERGTGLGLAIVNRIVESHGGSIEVKSRQGEGTVFRIFLPSARIVSLKQTADKV